MQEGSAVRPLWQETAVIFVLFVVKYSGCTHRHAERTGDNQPRGPGSQAQHHLRLRRPDAVDGDGLRGRRELAKEAAVTRVERGVLLEYLEAAKWNVAEAAKAAGYSRAQFYRLMKKHGIERRRHRGTKEDN